MKNKDGIELEIGQVWKGDYTCRIAGFDKGCAICKRHSYPSYFTLAPDSETFHILVKTPCGADLEKARKDGWLIWVPGTVRPEGEIEEAEYYNRGKWRESSFSNVANWGDLPRRYKLKPQAPSIPERLELKILRGVDKYECTSLGGKTVGVNEIRQALSVSGIEHDLIGFKYAESRHMSIFGPTAWWQKSYGDGCVPISHNSLSEGAPIFATHAVFLLTK